MAKRGKDKKSEEAKVEVKEVVEDTLDSADLIDLKHIRVAIEAYMNISPMFSVSDLTVQAKYVDKILGTSEKTPVIDDDYIPTHHEFVIECNIGSSKDLDLLISNPVIFTVFESARVMDVDLTPQLSAPAKPNELDLLLLSADSAADLLEAFTGKAVDRTAFVSSETSEGAPETRKGSKKDSKTATPKKESKNSKKDSAKSKVKEKPSELELPKEPVPMGTTTLDLLPLFQGMSVVGSGFKLMLTIVTDGENKVSYLATQLTETLLVHRMQKFYDDRIVPANMMPRLVVQVTIDEDTWLPDDPKSNVLSLTVESIYNLPAVMSQEMQYKVSMLMPSAFANWEYVVVSGGKLKEKIDMEKVKRWPGMLQDESLSGATKYRIEENTDTIKNDIEADLNLLNLEKPRIEWNVIKRNFMNETAAREFRRRLKKYRHVPLEVYVTSAQDVCSSADDSTSPRKGADAKGKGKSEASSKSEKGKKGNGGKAEKGGKKEDYLHLMTAADVSVLLYPGVQKCRVVCPLNTYQHVEILQQTGQTNSYFMPKVETPVPSTAKTDNKKKSAGKSDKGSTAKSDKSSKGGKGTAKGAGAKDNKTDLKPLLPPPPPPPPEPSTPVYNEQGQRTFILVEIELLQPLSPKRKVEDLSKELLQLIPKTPDITKVVMTSRLADLHFKDVIKQLTEDLVHQHQHYLKEKEQCKCELQQDMDDPQMAFLTFLQRSGVYHTYLASITKAASVVINDKFPNTCDFMRGSKEYQNLIAEVYSYLIKEMNGVLNELTSSGAEAAPVCPLVGLEPLLLYAREASAIGAKLLADRYLLERICRNSANGNYWFDYAVFQLEIGNKEKALECAKQCLEVNGRHRYSLLLCGILLSEKMAVEEAETCFLTAILQKQNWVEGWGAMHLFYSLIGNGEGADLCLGMANKCITAAEPVEADYFSSVDDLTWSTTICPNTVFFKTAMLLLKMRAFTYAEKSLVHELIRHAGICHYYLAVIMYFRRNYTHALVHLREAERLHGSDYAVASLTGHCFLALRKLENAKEQYLRVLESYDRPDDMHLLYMYLAVVWDRLGDKQSARKLLLVACKYSPTPYTWLTTGILYYGQRDLLSAEQCLAQANLCDNRLPEIWGYLTIVNLELERYTEAQLCYKQTLKNKMRDKDLEKRIHEAMKSLTNK